jgi:phenylalanyl-tRNA synthetase beta chain
VALAAIMGGLDSEVGEATTEVLLEAANFEPVGILRTSERLGLRTEGSNRWEKGVDPHLALPAARLATQLIVELAGARWTADNDVHGDLPEPRLLTFRPARAGRLIGLDVPEARQREILTRLEFGVDDGWTVTVPTWRGRDVTREIDLVEEVARFELDRVPFTRPRSAELYGRLTREQRLRRACEDVLVGCGLSETYTPSLVPAADAPGGLAFPVPLSAELAVLRTSLLPGLVQAARHNLDVGAGRVALFELARVYLPVSGTVKNAVSGTRLPEEPWRVGGIVDGGFFRAKGIVETLHEALRAEASFERADEPFLHPGRAARVPAGWLGELHPELLPGWSAFELDLATLFAGGGGAVQYEDVITYPPVKQDLAFVVDASLAVGDLFAAAHEAAGPDLRETTFLSDYRGDPIPPGRKSIAFSVVFQSPERTLSDEDAARLRRRIVDVLGERFGAELRA